MAEAAGKGRKRADHSVPSFFIVGVAEYVQDRYSQTVTAVAQLVA
jgi:hypothetical protein